MSSWGRPASWLSSFRACCYSRLPPSIRSSLYDFLEDTNLLEQLEDKRVPSREVSTRGSPGRRFHTLGVLERSWRRRERWKSIFSLRLLLVCTFILYIAIEQVRVSLPDSCWCWLITVKETSTIPFYSSAASYMLSLGFVFVVKRLVYILELATSCLVLHDRGLRYY